MPSGEIPLLFCIKEKKSRRVVLFLRAAATLVFSQIIQLHLKEFLPGGIIFIIERVCKKCFHTYTSLLFITFVHDRNFDLNLRILSLSLKYRPIQHLKHNLMRWPINRKMKSPLKGDILFPF